VEAMPAVSTIKSEDGYHIYTIQIHLFRRKINSVICNLFKIPCTAHRSCRNYIKNENRSPILNHYPNLETETGKYEKQEKEKLSSGSSRGDRIFVLVPIG